PAGRFLFAQPAVKIDEDVLGGDAVDKLFSKPVAHEPVMAGEPNRDAVFLSVFAVPMIAMMDIAQTLTVLADSIHASIGQDQAAYRSDRGGIVPALDAFPDLEAGELDLETDDRSEQPHAPIPPPRTNRR